MENDDCLFCRIIHNETQSFKVYENDFCIAILDKYPTTPGHTLVITKHHFSALDQMDPVTTAALFQAVSRVAKVLKLLTPNSTGINILQNNGKGAGQEILHVHCHIIPRFPDDHIRFKFPKVSMTDAQMHFIAEKMSVQLKDNSV